MPGDIKSLQRALLVIATEIDRICRKNDIRYVLMFGSLLGAVRHKGFIPWDDDVDMGMLREDYKKFITACDRDLDKDHFALQTWDTDDAYVQPFAKIRLKGSYMNEPDWKNTGIREHGLFVDIFPYDAVPRNRALAVLQSAAVFVLHRLLLLNGHVNIFLRSSVLKNVLKKIMNLFALLIPRSLLKAVLKKMMIRNTAGADFVSTEEMLPFYEKRLPKTVFENVRQYNFDGLSFFGPEDYKTCLTRMFGPDYMTPPSAEKRIWHNNGYDLENVADFILTKERTRSSSL